MTLSGVVVLKKPPTRSVVVYYGPKVAACCGDNRLKGKDVNRLKYYA